MSAISAPAKLNLTIAKGLLTRIRALGTEGNSAFEVCRAQARITLAELEKTQDLSEPYPIFAPDDHIAYLILVRDPGSGGYLILDFIYFDQFPTPPDDPPGARNGMADHFARLLGLGDDTTLSDTNPALFGDRPINAYAPAIRVWSTPVIAYRDFTPGDLTAGARDELVLDGLDTLGDFLRALCGRPVPCGRDSSESRSCQFGPGACRTRPICQGFDTADGADLVGPPLGLPPP